MYDLIRNSKSIYNMPVTLWINSSEPLCVFADAEHLHRVIGYRDENRDLCVQGDVWQTEEHAKNLSAPVHHQYACNHPVLSLSQHRNSIAPIQLLAKRVEEHICMLKRHPGFMDQQGHHHLKPKSNSNGDSRRREFGKCFV